MYNRYGADMYNRHVVVLHREQYKQNKPTTTLQGVVKKSLKIVFRLPQSTLNGLKCFLSTLLSVDAKI